MGKLLLFGEPLIRLTSPNSGKFHDGCSVDLFYGGSEVNIACALEGFGRRTKLFTAVPDNLIGDSFLQFLHSHGIDSQTILRTGERLGIYYVEEGFGCRPGKVYYDRQFTSISTIQPQSLDVNKIFQDVSHFHFSGITLALGQPVQAIAKRLLEEAKQRGITISFDLNLRTQLISVSEAKQLFSTFAPYADYCFGIEPLMLDEFDVQLFDRERASLEELKKRMRELKKLYQFKAIFHTVRQSNEDGTTQYQAYGYDDQLYSSVQLRTKVLQRIGSGDAFVAGALHQLLNGASYQRVVDFAVASGIYKCTLIEDTMHESCSAIDQLLYHQKDIIR
ncbi:sugar kinase [Streptococcus ovuberis]|uniref:Sugar kinase n=1 Tax=Streptococcus ovuberis TaxID=1936207 RepID=A0A7X6N087_9STRE|nr:sugar kinase [Streptococcus ovuberis]NKZ20668.1 sugar kinase [Streptococcus ovuberis]